MAIPAWWVSLAEAVEPLPLFGGGHFLTAVTSHEGANLDCPIFFFPKDLKLLGTHNFGWSFHPMTPTIIGWTIMGDTCSMRIAKIKHTIACKTVMCPTAQPEAWSDLNITLHHTIMFVHYLNPYALFRHIPNNSLHVLYKLLLQIPIYYSQIWLAWSLDSNTFWKLSCWFLDFQITWTFKFKCAQYMAIVVDNLANTPKQGKAY